MAFEKVSIPEHGERITFANGVMHVPDNPILMYIEGDGIGYDIDVYKRQRWG